MGHQPFTIDTLFRVQHVASRVPLDLSPDGAYLTLTVQTHQQRNAVGNDRVFTAEGVPVELLGSRVLVVDTTTGEVVEPFRSSTTSWGAQWAPDGHALAAYVQEGRQPPCLGIWKLATGATRRFPRVRVRPVFGFEIPRWLPDSRSVVVKLVPTTPPVTPTVGQPVDEGSGAVHVFAFDPATAEGDPTAAPTPFDWYRCDLGLVDVRTGAVRILAADQSLVGWEVAPDGQAVAALVDTHFDSRLTQFFFDLQVIPLDGSPPRTVATHIPQPFSIAFAWSPDSQTIAYTTNALGQSSQLWVAPADGSGAAADLTGAVDIGVAHELAAPRWTSDGQYVACRTTSAIWAYAADGSGAWRLPTPSQHEVIGWAPQRSQPAGLTITPESLLAIVRNLDAKDEGLARLALTDGAAMLVAQFAKTCVDPTFGVAATADGTTVYLVLQAADHPAELWRISAQTGTSRRLLTLNPDLTDLALGTSRLVSWRSLDGRRLQGALLTPAGYRAGQPVPLIVQVYGGFLGSNVLHRFAFDGAHLDNAQLLASHGYAVLWPDLPLDDHAPLDQLPGLVLPAVNQLIDQGIIDPDRIGLLGHSYGGYGVLALLTQTTRFRAAVCIAGMTNLTSFYGVLTPEGVSNWLGWCETGQGRLGGSLWERRAAYIENSPLFYLDRVTTPILLVSGTAHPGEPAQSAEAFSALRRLGKRVELRIYDGEAHWPAAWSAASVRDLCARGLRWFDEHLTVAPTANPDTGDAQETGTRQAE
jgi:dipeptidyl aminopeptidase/acylaminoacyl peptidase